MDLAQIKQSQVVDCQRIADTNSIRSISEDPTVTVPEGEPPTFPSITSQSTADPANAAIAAGTPPEKPVFDSYFKGGSEESKQVVLLVRDAFKSCFINARDVFVSREDYIECSRLISKAAQKQQKDAKVLGTVGFLLPGTAQAAKAAEEVERQSKKKETTQTRKELQSLKSKLHNLEVRNRKMQAELDKRKQQQQKINKQKTNE